MMSKRLKPAAWLGLCAAIILLAGCGPAPTDPPPTATVSMPGGIQTAPATAPGGIQVPTDSGPTPLPAEELLATATSVPPQPTQPEPVLTDVAATPEATQPPETSPLWAVFFNNPITDWDPALAVGGIEENLVWLIDNAEATIDAAVFEFDLQNVADALIRAHNRGVRVRMVYDDEHTEEDPQMAQVIAAGIPAVPDGRSAYMHNKFFVFDGDLVWTGSMNITVNGAYRNNNNSLAIISPELGENYTREFEEMFSGNFGPQSAADTPFPVTRVGAMQVENYFAPEDVVMERIVEIVGGAQQSIHFMVFAFTHGDLSTVMIERAFAGVEVAGVFETRGANTQYSECNVLREYGIDVRLDSNPRTMHHKVIIVDGEIIITGSFNFSKNATTSNDENLLVLYDADLAAHYEQEFYELMRSANFPDATGCVVPETP